MRNVKLSNGDSIYICKKDEQKPDGIWFLEEEWAWAQRLGKSRSDPQEQKDFFMGLVEAKTANPNVSVFDLFPKEGSGSASDPSLQREPSAQACAQEKNTGRKSFPGEAICRETIEMLKGRGAKTRREREEEAG